MARRSRQAIGLTAALVVLAALGALAAGYGWREEILRTALDPKQPFQTYRPPPAPDYADRRAWALRPARAATSADPLVDVFFVHPTTFNGGRDWNGPIGERDADRFLFRVALPNGAGPFQRVGRVFAPRYRQASLYAFLTLRDDAREARRFAYGDVRAAFLSYLAHDNAGRPLILAGVGQGGELVSHLVQDVVARDPALTRRVAAVYLVDTIAPVAEFPPTSALPACSTRSQARCVVAWMAVPIGDDAQARRLVERALVWTPDGQLMALGARPVLCVNPLTGAQGGQLAPAKLNEGAAGASGLEWGARPGFLAHQVSAQCIGGLLRVSWPSSPSLQPSGSWADRRKTPPFNLFYADEEADAQARVEALLGRTVYGPAAPPISTSTPVADAPVRRID